MLIGPGDRIDMEVREKDYMDLTLVNIYNFTVKYPLTSLCRNNSLNTYYILLTVLRV